MGAAWMKPHQEAAAERRKRRDQERQAEEQHRRDLMVWRLRTVLQACFEGVFGLTFEKAEAPSSALKNNMNNFS